MPDVTTDFETLAKAVDQAAEAVEALPQGAAKDAALELKDAIEAAHKAGLVTIVQKLKADEAGKKLLFELVDDPVVRMLFALHKIIRTAPPDGISSSGGGKSGRDLVAERLHSHDGVPKQSGPALIPLNAVRRRDPVEEELEADGWIRTVAVKGIPEGEATRVRVGDEDVVLVWARGELVAYENRCAHQDMPLNDALVDSMACTVMCPWHGYRYDSRTGECLTEAGMGLSKRDVKVVGRDVWIRGARR